MIRCPHCNAPGNYLRLILRAKDVPYRCCRCGKPLKARYTKAGSYCLIGVISTSGTIANKAGHGIINQLSQVVAVQWLLLALVATLYGAIGVTLVSLCFLQLVPLEPIEDTRPN